MSIDTGKINYTLERLNAEQDARTQVRTLLLSLIAEFKIKNCAIVELGSGIGSNLVLFLPSNRVLGVEGLVDAAIQSRALGVDTVVANLEQSVPIQSGKFDWVLCLDVLEHLLAPDACMREAHQLLRPGGKLILNVPNHFTLTGRVRILCGSGVHWPNFFPENEDWNNPHVRFFTQRSIYRLLTHCGFKVIRDLSAEVPAVPMSHELKQFRLGRLVEMLARTSQDLFCGGFFIVAERK